MGLKKSDETKGENLGRPVLVTTAHRGVFFGYLVGEAKKESVTIDRPRNVTYWSADVHGFLGLAAKGPTKSCKVGPAGERSTPFDITGVWGCTDAARAAFEAEPWA